jgi:hypothetical protein
MCVLYMDPTLELNRIIVAEEIFFLRVVADYRTNFLLNMQLKASQWIYFWFVPVKQTADLHEASI